MTVQLPPFTAHFSTLATGYDALLCDVWGVVHNGVAAFPDACDALLRFREQGGRVSLITNSPRPSEIVVRQLAKLNVPRETYDAIVSSGDITRGVIKDREGESLFHLGPQRDRPIFDGLKVREAPVQSADYVVCSGLYNDEVDKPEDYRDQLDIMRERGLFMVCANPDRVVERGDKLIYCAGAIADLYASMGGEVLYAGKPYAPIYEQALAWAEAKSGRKLQRERILAIGDSLRTDFTGARDFGVDFLFVTSGIHAEEFGARHAPDEAALQKMFSAAGGTPKALMQRLIW